MEYPNVIKVTRPNTLYSTIIIIWPLINTRPSSYRVLLF